MKILLKAATILSYLSHPLFTSLFIVVTYSLTRYSRQQSMMIMTILLLGVVLPMNLVTYLGVRKGRFDDFDVSTRSQRSPLLIMLIIIMLIASGAIYLLGLDRVLFLNCLITSSLFLTVYLINFRLKVSLHVSLNIFFCFILYQIHPISAIALASILPLVAFSRVLLKRHTVSEVAVGTAIGTLFGSLTSMV
jgi:membrane-associated phospholipid phosphatase